MRRILVLAIFLIFICSQLCFAYVIKQYYPSGKLFHSQVYYDNGMVKGPLKIYWANGRLRQKVIYKNYEPYITENWSENGVRLH